LEVPYYVPPGPALELMRLYYPKGPILVMEYYPAWFDREGHLPHETLSSSIFCKAMDNLLSYNVSLSIYPVFGGTNFGFTNGAEHPIYIGPIETTRYRAVTTTYDFDAPISESGHTTPKFSAIRDIIKKYTDVPPGPVPPPSTKGNYGTVVMNTSSTLFENLAIFNYLNAPQPIEMERLGYGYGYVLYITELNNIEKPAQLVIKSLQDRGLVYLDGIFQGILGWAEINEPTSITITPKRKNPTLQILVENKGRPSGEVVDFKYARKGIYGVVELDTKLISTWTMYLLPMDNIVSSKIPWNISSKIVNTPTFYRNVIVIPSTPLHTFMLIDGWGKGVVFLNGFNLGRFSDLGPQRTLYVPASILRTGVNEILIFESDPPHNSEFTNITRNIIFIDHQLWK